MKIAMVSEHASPLAAVGAVDAGGQNLHVAELAAALARQGHQLDVYTRRDDSAAPDRVEVTEGYAVEHVPAGPAEPLRKDELLPYMPAFGDHLTERWRRDRPDIVHAHFWMSGLAALSAARTLDIPAVQTFHALGVVKKRHQQGKDTSPAARIRLEREVALGMDRIIATATDEVRELTMMGVPPSSISVVPCGVNLDHFGPEGPAAAKKRPRVLAVGRLVERKGFDLLIEALRDIPDAELVIAGGPPELAGDAEAQRLLNLAEVAGVGDRVRLLGPVSRHDMPALIRSADVVAHAPWYEPFGMVPLEAMACARPCVVTAVGGLTDTVVDHQTGLVVPPHEPKLLADALGELLADAPRRRRYGAAGLARARELYSWRSVAAATAAVYREVTAPVRCITDRAPRVPALVASCRAQAHIDAAEAGLAELRRAAPTIDRWGHELRETLARGGRLLAAGNGGSAAQAQHLTAELVGRYCEDRTPFSAIALHAETSALTAIGNDYGYDEVFARQVTAHGRPGDVLMLLSTSGRSPNLLRAVEEARRVGVHTWALTGPECNPLADVADDVICLEIDTTATIQELHLVAVHMLCEVFDAAVAASAEPAALVGGA